ncbi:MAG: hypothetical protein JWO71_4067 [Candidatus Acidoferrum typicum]|nr:hypothetical protein [Candidatus Acidoferrum typicum]
MTKTHRTFLAVLALLLPRCTSAGPAPLDRAEIFGRLTQGYSPSYVAHLVKIRGVSFSPSADFLFRVKLAGGDGILVERLSSSDLAPAKNSSNRDRPFEHFARCAELIHVGDNEQAERECQAAIDENPESAWPIMAAIHALTATGNPAPDKVARLRRAVALDPSLISAHRALVSSDLGPEESERELRKVSELEQVEASDDYVSAGAYAGAYPFEAMPATAIDSTETRRFVEAQIPFFRGKCPDLAAGRLRVASLYGRLGDLDNAYVEIQEALRLEPGNPYLHLNLAAFYLFEHHTEAEFAEYREAIRIAPYAEPLRSSLVEALVREQHADEGIREWKAFLTLSPRSVAASRSLIDLYLAGQDRKSAIAELRRSLKASSDAIPDQAQYVESRIEDLDRLGHLLFDNGEADAAAQQYTFLLRFMPDSSVLHNNLGNVLFGQRRCEDASREYREALRLQPDLADAHHNLANCLFMAKKADDAIAEYQQTLELDPSKYQTQMMLGAAFLQKGYINDAMEQFQKVLTEHPEDAEVRMLLGHSYYLHKELSSAIVELKHALAIKPNFPQAENDLAWIYATAEDLNLRNPSEALRLAKHAVDNSPRPAPEILDTLAEALLQNGQPAEALKTEHQAVSLDPKNPEMQSRLARFQAAYSGSSASQR